MRSEPTTLDETDDFPVKIEPGELPSGRQEMLENLINDFI